MSDFYIYSSRYSGKNENQEEVYRSVTVIFCGGDGLSEINLQNEIREFYECNYQTDDIFILGGEYLKEKLELAFITNQSDTFKYVPKLESLHLSNNIYLLLFDKDGRVNCNNKELPIEQATLKYLINYGLVNIFIKRGGLIEAKGDAHHFVFPSGKHCNKFLRTGNILMNSAEIYFIAFSLLHRYKEQEHEKVFCDTSSINTLAFALIDLKRRFLPKGLKSIPIQSFSSYDGLFSKTVRFFGNSLILISSSTSGNIIERIRKHDDNVILDNIVILFFLGPKSEFKRKENNIICNLTKEDASNHGIDFYETYTKNECILCESGSYPVEVKGDVFLLEKPKVNRITINVTDAPKKLSKFVTQFQTTDKSKLSVLKVNYKENRFLNTKYDVYFDMFNVLSSIVDHPNQTQYKEYKSKLYDYINQYIPSNTKYLIALPDEGSLKLADIIKKHISRNYRKKSLPEIVKFDDVVKCIDNKLIEGAAVIIGSCIANGKNLLYLSRTLRSFNKLKLIYFIGLARTENQRNLEFLKSNLKQGNYGKETNSFVEVESFYCNNDTRNTTWLNEKEFLNDLLELAESKNLKIAEQEIFKRIESINDSLSSEKKGLANNIFYPNTNNEELRLRKNFAFVNFNNVINEISQSDVYFCVSSILNHLRNEDDHSHCLKQSEYVRNILDPYNFNRYNDGIIQASILRSAKQSELSYHVDTELSRDIRLILEKIIDQHTTPQGEGLIEFLFAIATEKLTLKREHLSELSLKVGEIKNNELVQVFNEYIKATILETKPTLQEQYSKLEEEVKKLRTALNNNGIQM